MKLLPAILTDSMATFQEQMESVKPSELVDTLHVDVIDGLFVDNTTITPMDLTLTDFEDLKIDFHFMTEEPMDYVYECEAIKEYLPIRRIYSQIERMSQQADYLLEVKKNGWEAGLSLDIFTPLESIDDDVWPDVHHVLLMAIEAGHQNQIFNTHVLEKVKELRERVPATQKLTIAVDGGVKLNNVAQIIAAGVDEVSVGSGIWKSANPVQAIEEFFQTVKQ